MKTKGWIKAIACGLCVSMLFQSAAFAAENNGISDKTVLESSETVTDETFSESLESANSETETKETDAEVSETETEAVRETKDTSETDQIQMNQETKAPETATAESEDIKSQNNEDTYTVSVKLDEENEKIIAELKYSGDTSAIENIAFPTWTEENGQDDIIWEVASQVDSSTWRAEILLKNYDYAKGIYNVHAYAYFKDGTYECAGTEALDVQVDPKGILKISVNNHAQIEAVLSNVKNADEVDHVAFPVWTEKNGQDDIVWHIADKNSDGTYSAVIDSANHNNESGLYNVHAYTYDKSDNATFIDGTSCTVERITAATGIQLLDQDAASGKFRAQIINVQSSSEITGVRFGVWTDKNGQDDIRWYNASHSGNVWYADISAENHNYESGTYHLVCYAADVNGTDQLLSAADKVLNVSDPGEMTVKVDSKQSKITVTLTGTNFGKDVTRVAFAVWTEANGQDDIVRHIATKKNSSTYEAVIDIKNHNGETGQYNIHAYKYMGDKAEFLHAGTCNIQGFSAATGVQLLDQNTAMGKFRAQIVNVKSPATVTSVRFAVWTDKNGKDDLVWYNGTHSGNVWYADISASNHDFESGKYNIQCYAYDSRGAQQCITAAVKTVKVTQKSGFSKEADGNTYYYNSDGTRVKGWKTINNNKYYFDAKTGAMQTGWNYVGGYKLYFKSNGVLSENVDSLIGKQSSYYVKVNTSTNTVTIFAKDGSNGYIIPVKKMICSTGKSGTPTIKGTFTIKRYARWGTLMGPVYGQYCSQIYGGYLFHSAWYYVNGNNRTLSVSEYRKLGTNASHGCVRLTVADAKWIYDNCNGSTVYVYSKGSDGDPFRKPSRPNPVVISGDYGYDPTDPAFN